MTGRPGDDRTVIIGGGQAALSVIESLRAGNHAGPITLVDAHEGLPYQRPPLSKAYLAGTGGHDTTLLRPASYYVENDVELMLGSRCVAVHREERQVELASGERLSYGHLVLAPGSAPRQLVVPGADLDGVLTLHGLADADLLREALGAASSLVVIGGGFIGLEVASFAAKSGLAVTVLEAGERLMQRSSSPMLSEFIRTLHTAAGVDIRLGARVVSIEGDRAVEGVVLADGERFPADVVLVAVGSVPATAAIACDVDRADGGAVLVGPGLVSSDRAILAAGDSASFIAGDGRCTRLESVQNATDQGRCVAASIMGRPTAFDAVPWFWTEQLGAKVQIAGLVDRGDRWVLRGSLGDRRFTIFSYAGDQLLAAESVGRVADHIGVRAILKGGGTLSPAHAADVGVDLRKLAAEAQ
ncbi:pyridine nucleotide-disulfide oxidoreductase [Aeromicrobium sp. S22]|uniref:NAD(P)/FAD-dependent oxidoreductase n=1 Tax=Aeromicrobium sp. S22 TaxID=2662029 RepID=UPI0013C27C40|nr:FAD-dependent oxidoreductase [Aeromicrobium sp. S22]MRK02803.1 pyridine nucleotide-disulfide oxidoreductase [Aeromicrobium sp. S22]